MSTFAVNKIIDTDNRAVFVCTGIFTSGTQETAVLKIDASTLNGYNPLGLGPAPTPILHIRRVVYSVTTGAQVQIIFDGASAQTALVVTNSGEFDLTGKGAALNNGATTPTGDILFTTLGFGANQSYTVLIEVTKASGF
jgi:hypothetical protein